MSEKISAFISITTEHMQPEEIQDRLIETVNPIEIYFVTGDYDYIMKVTVEDMDSLREKVSKLRELNWIKKTNTSIILRKL
ncbi:MAG: Lrp/AsnC family transcriptional regulator [Candidatus Odinarchaeia archaeon]